MPTAAGMTPSKLHSEVVKDDKQLTIQALIHPKQGRWPVFSEFKVHKLESPSHLSLQWLLLLSRGLW